VAAQPFLSMGVLLTKQKMGDRIFQALAFDLVRTQVPAVSHAMTRVPTNSELSALVDEVR
jgi:hypothetical protein